MIYFVIVSKVWHKLWSYWRWRFKFNYSWSRWCLSWKNIWIHGLPMLTLWVRIINSSDSISQRLLEVIWHPHTSQVSSFRTELEVTENPETNKGFYGKDFFFFFWPEPPWGPGLWCYHEWHPLEGQLWIRSCFILTDERDRERDTHTHTNTHTHIHTHTDWEIKRGTLKVLQWNEWNEMTNSFLSLWSWLYIFFYSFCGYSKDKQGSPNTTPGANSPSSAKARNTSKNGK